MDKQELIAELLSSYRQELEALTDAELYDHWKTTKAVKALPDSVWQDIASGMDTGRG